jgi:sec-independent protein translocase protein TatA
MTVTENAMGLPNIGPVELIIVLVIALLVLGPGKLPEVGSAFGKTIREFKKASSDITESTSLSTTPTTPAAAAAAPTPAPAPNTLAQATAPNTLSEMTEPALKGAPVDPAADHV